MRELFPASEVTFEEVPTPDPREPSRAVPFVAWTYRGLAARPALPAPSAGISAHVSEIARRPYALDEWSRSAAAVCAQLTGTRQEEIVAAMVHPPRPPAGVKSWDWRFRVQVASALLLARSTEARGGRARSTLLDLIDGPVDWTTTAGVIALLDVARRHADDRSTAAEDLLRLAGRPPSPIWSMWAALPALLAVMDVPGLGPALYDRGERSIEAAST